MAILACRTKGNGEQIYKMKAFFTCHPDDFDECLDKIAFDILEKLEHDCSIYYTETKNEVLDDIDICLGNKTVLLIAVTYRLLNDIDKNKQVFVALDYAKSHGMNIIPILMESPDEDFLKLYSDHANFGNMQYIDRNNMDENIGYYKMLKKHLDNYSLTRECVNKISTEFDSFVFLSYRKKDAVYARELMKYIHELPSCYDIAIWYDEFLPLGEDWRSNINESMKIAKDSSNLFILMVTPNIPEEVNGKPNFVVGTECPMARDMKMEILPIEVEDTDRSSLHSALDYIPDCFEKRSSEFEKKLEALVDIDNDSDPEHLYYMGLAYLHGINVEVDRDLGVSFLEFAANNGSLDAIDALYNIASNLKHRGYYSDAMNYYDSVLANQIKYLPEEDKRILITKIDRVDITTRYCKEQECLDAVNMLQEEMAKYLGDDNYDDDNEIICRCYHAMARCYMMIGYMYDEAIKCFDKALEFYDKIENLDLITFTYDDILSELAIVHSLNGNPHYALEIKKNVYNKKRKMHGDNAPSVIQALGSIAATYFSMYISYPIGNKNKDAEKLLKEAIRINRKVLKMKLDSKNFGPYHSSTITTANNLICNLLETDGCHGEYYDAIRIGIDTYNLMMTKGLRYPIILNLLFGVAAIYQKLALLQSTKNASAYRKDAIKWLEKADGLAALMELSETIQGLRIKRDLANLYLYIGDSKYAKITNMAEVKENARKVINLLAPVYESSRIYMGKTGSDIADDIFVLLDRAYNRLFNILCDEKEYFEAYNILNAMYIIWRKEKGASDPETVRIATSLLNFKFRP